MSATLLGKVLDMHQIADVGDGFDLLPVDRHLIHDLGGTRNLPSLERTGRSVANPKLAFATADHSVSTMEATATTRLHSAGSNCQPCAA